MASVSVAFVAVLARPYLQNVLMSQQYQRKLSVLAAEYRAALRDVNRRADEIGAAFFDSKRDYFQRLVDELGKGEPATRGAMESMLQATKKMAAMELRIYAMRQHSIKLRQIGAKSEASKMRDAIEDQEKDNNDDYIPRMRQSGYPINDLIIYIRQTISTTA